MADIPAFSHAILRLQLRRAHQRPGLCVHLSHQNSHSGHLNICMRGIRRGVPYATEICHEQPYTNVAQQGRALGR